MSKKSIALIDPVGGKAGMDFYDSSLLKGMVAQGYDTYLFSNFDCKAEGIHCIRSFNNVGIHKVAAIFNNFIYFLKALGFCRRNHVSWLLLHFFRGGLFDLVTIGIARLLGLKIILIIHDVKSLERVVLPFTRRIILTRFNHSKIVHNQYSHNQLAEIIGPQSMGNVYIIPHGNFVELAHQTPSKILSLPEFVPRPGQRYLLFFGQLKRSKGLDILIKALSFSQSSSFLIIAGRERDGSFSEYRRLIEETGLTDKIIPIIRFIEDEERDFLFRCCEAVVIPYKKVYQSGVLLMAFSYSKIVIASDLAPNRELIKNEENGLLFDSENPLSLSAVIQKFERGFYNTKAMERHAFQCVQEGHNWREIGRLYARILET